MLGRLSYAVALLAAFADATSRTSAPSGAIVVAKSGGQYTTLQAAINSISTSSTTTRTIFIQPGTYSEQVLIPSLAGKLSIYGYTSNDQDFNSNQVTITNSLGADVAGNNDASGTLRVKSSNIHIYNLNVVNGRGSGVQAIALSAYGGNQGYYGCKFIGYQDTVLANTGTQVYNKCYIEGATDFIFGQTAIAWFEKGTIAISGKGYITANGRDSSTNPSYYVLNGVTVTTKSGVSLASGSTYLGRPWRNYSRVVFQNSNLGAVVNSAGWVQWSSTTPNTDHVYYGEYGNTGTGASGTRASFSTKMSSAVTISSIVGSSYTSWVDMNYWNNVSSGTTTTTAAGVTTTTTSRSTTTTTTGGSTGCTTAIYGQCGGSGFTGCTTCASGSTCVYSNDWYSQCLAA